MSKTSPKIISELHSMQIDKDHLASRDPTSAWRAVDIRGKKITSREASVLEDYLETNTSDLILRLALVAFYQSRRTVAFRQEYYKHILWFVQNMPESWAAENCRYEVRDNYYRRVRKEWFKLIDLDPTNTRLIDQAANFCYLLNMKKAEILWRTAQQLEPWNPMWSYNLVRIYQYSVGPKKSKSWNKLMVGKALIEWDRVCKSDPIHRENTYLSKGYIEITQRELDALAGQYGLL